MGWKQSISPGMFPNIPEPAAGQEASVLVARGLCTTSGVTRGALGDVTVAVTKG